MTGAKSGLPKKPTNHVIGTSKTKYNYNRMTTQKT